MGYIIDTQKIPELLRSEMVFIPEKVLRDCDVPLSAKDWLATVGVPKSVDLPFGLVLNGLDDLKLIVNEFRSGFRIGETDGPSYIAIRPDGGVIMLSESNYPGRFVNSSVSQFVMSLCVFAELSQGKIDVSQFQSQLKEVDPESTVTEDLFWSLAVEEIVNFELYQ